MLPAPSAIEMRPELQGIRSMVVKIGSRVLTSDKDSACGQRLRLLTDDIAQLKNTGVQVVVVSSGAIAQGMGVLNLKTRPSTIPMKQACASIGQSRLMEMYESLFRRHSMSVGQVLLTWDDLRDKTRHLNLRNTLFQLLQYRAIPIVNENDSVGIEEIRFGDNDTLGAQISMLLGAELYVILTDVNGLYDRNPHTGPSANHIPVVPRLTPHIRDCATGSRSRVGVGGMTTKLDAADQVTRSGAHAIIGNGHDCGLIRVLTDERRATLFLPGRRKMNARHRWIAFSGKSKGVVLIDAGARKAVCERGKSLLPAGVRKVKGDFRAGDTVDVQDEKGHTIARGLTNYSSEEIHKTRGLRTAQIRGALGQKLFDETIHRDNMVLL